LRVYEDFFRGGVQPNPEAMGLPNPGIIGPPAMPMRGPQMNEAENIPVNPMQQIMEKAAMLLNELDKQVKQCPLTSVATLPPSHDIVSLVRQINLTATQYLVRDDMALWFTQKLAQLYFKVENEIGHEIYLVLLERMCELSKRVAREFAAWLLFSDDEVRHSRFLDSKISLIIEKI
jgi:hypothetical protein